MFCDKDEESVPEEERHNSVAPNAQNKLCDWKSAWEVMREHNDFKSRLSTNLFFPSVGGQSRMISFKFMTFNFNPTEHFIHL